MAFRARRDCGFGLGAGPVSASFFGRYCLPLASLSFLAMLLLLPRLQVRALVLLQQLLKISRRWRQHQASQPEDTPGGVARRYGAVARTANDDNRCVRRCWSDQREWGEQAR